jgi:hypothetical protein
MAFAVNSAGEVVALGGRGGRPTAPFIANLGVGGSKPLDDPHFVSGIPDGFEWGAPASINPQGWISGNGLRQGRAVAWVLRRHRGRDQ